MLGKVKDFIEQQGYTGVVVLMALENIFPPVPSEAIMPLAGFFAAQGRLSFAGVVLAGMLGSVIGSLPLYYLGRRVGVDRLKRWADRYGKWLLVSREDLERGEAWFARYGSAAVFLGRLIPGVRSLISIPAGVAGMHFGLFLLYTAIGTTIWAGLLALAGKLLQQNYDRVEAYLGPVAYAVLGGLAVWFVVRAIRKARIRRAEG